MVSFLIFVDSIYAFNVKYEWKKLKCLSRKYVILSINEACSLIVTMLSMVPWGPGLLGTKAWKLLGRKLLHTYFMWSDEARPVSVNCKEWMG